VTILLQAAAQVLVVHTGPLFELCSHRLVAESRGDRIVALSTRQHRHHGRSCSRLLQRLDLGPTVMSTAGVPYIGSRISLLSKSSIRYEGTLYSIDTQVRRWGCCRLAVRRNV